MVKTTKAQRIALYRVWVRLVQDTDAYRLEVHRAQHSLTRGWFRLHGPLWLMYRAFRRTVQPGPGCIMVPFAGMWLGIEPDGYTHS